MTKEQTAKIMEIVDDNVQEILDKYLSYELVRKISTEIRAGVQWDLVNKAEGRT
jgi:hypothetical protein